MRILHIARWCSARVYKQVLCQQAAGWDVTLMAGQSPHMELQAMVEKCIGWCNASVLGEVSDMYDVAIVHTTISTINDIHLPVCSKRRIWDCHDYVCNYGHEMFDAVTCPSNGMAKRFHNGVVVYSKVPSALWPINNGCDIDAYVLAATIGNGEQWSNYEGISERLGSPVFIYPSGEYYEGHKNELIMKRLSYIDMLSALTRYKAGYAGAANDKVSIHDCVTNKFWEYIAAGIEPITYRSDEMEALMREANVRQTAAMEHELTKMEEAYEI